jgi:hypothetical protein
MCINWTRKRVIIILVEKHQLFAKQELYLIHKSSTTVEHRIDNTHMHTNTHSHTRPSSH